MTVYVGLYTGEASKDVLSKSPVRLGGSPDVYIVDLIYDDECKNIKRKLNETGIRCTIKPGEGMEFDQVSNVVSRLCIEHTVEKLQNEESPDDFRFEIGNLDNILSGAMFLASFRNGGEVISYSEGGINHLSTVRPLPNVDRRGYTAQMILNVLYLNDELDYVTIRNKIHESETAGMDDSEMEDFFKRHHNTYKVLQRLIEDGWVEYNKSNKKYTITAEGNTARVMFELRDLENEKRTRHGSKE